MQDSQFAPDQESPEMAFPMMIQTASGEPNRHPELTVLKPPDQRSEQELHPSQIIEASSQVNYYKYGWMANVEPTSALNYTALASLAALIAICVYLLVCTKLLRFIQFFLLQKQYKRLNLKISHSAVQQDEQQSSMNAIVTPRQNLFRVKIDSEKQNDRDSLATRQGIRSIQLLEKPPANSQQQRSGLMTNLGHHARQLMQFYTPTLALTQVLTCSKNLSLPRYVIVWQLAFRIVFLTVFTVAACYIYLYTALDKNQRDCLLSQSSKANSFYCLNEMENHGNETSPNENQAQLQAVGIFTAIVGAFIMLTVSHSVFSGYTQYLTKLIGAQYDAWDTDRGAAIRAPSKHNQSGLSNDSVVLQPLPSSSRNNSPSKKRSHKSPLKKQKKQDTSVTSFRALFDRDSDSSMLNLQSVDGGYDSGVGQNSMSTQANLLNLSERGGFLDISRTSARGDTSINLGNGGKKVPQIGVPNLLPIDEDVDDEKCSPIKPKKRTDEDSPFKKHFAKQASMKSGKQSAEPVLLISSEEDAVVDIDVGGFGVELDRHRPEDVSSLNLNSGILVTPPRHINSSPQKQASDFDEHFDHDMSGIASQGGFQLQVEQIKPNSSTSNGGHFDHIRTLNSGNNNTLGEGQDLAYTKNGALNSGGSQKPNSGHVNSFSNVDDSTLQLDTVAPIKPRLASSSINDDNNQAQENQYSFSHQQQPPQSVRNSNRVNLGLITPFNADGSQKDVATDDRNSLRIGNVQNINEFHSSDQRSNSIRPESGQATNFMPKHIKKGVAIFNEELSVINQSPEQVNEKENKKALIFLRIKGAFTILTVTALVFCVCLDAYYLFNATDEGVVFALISLVSAFVMDIVIQIVVLLVMSSVQFGCEVNHRNLPLDTAKLQFMTTQARDLAKQVFVMYKERSALLRVDYQDQEELLVEKVQNDLNSDLSKVAYNIGSNDILVKNAQTKLTINGLVVEIEETLKFRPPQIAASKKDQKINIVTPNREQSQPEQVLSSGDEEALRKRRRFDVTQYERTHKFFAGQMPIVQKRLKKDRDSPHKRSETMLKRSIENIELQKLENDFLDITNPKKNKKSLRRSQTPDKIKVIKHSSLVAHSHTKKVSQFETPKMSQVKIRQTITAQADQAPSEKFASRTDLKDVQRKLLIQQSSQSFADSKSLIGKLDTIKKYIEDEDQMQGIAGVILSNSSKSLVAAEGVPKDAGRRLVGPLDTSNVYRNYNRERDLSMDREQRAHQITDKYSPVFSSVNRKEVANQKIENSKTQEQQLTVNGVNSFERMQMAQIQDNSSGYQRQPTCPPVLNVSGISRHDSSNPQLVQAILSHRETLSKQQSFNSPRSLHDKLQLTNEKIQSSIEGSSINKGRRKMVMLDEAGMSKQSLNFGVLQASGTVLVNSQHSGVLKMHGSSINNSSINTTPLRQQEASRVTVKADLALVQTQKSQVLFEDQSQPHQNRDSKHQNTNKDAVLVKNGLSSASQDLKVLNQKRSSDGGQSSVISQNKRSSIQSKKQSNMGESNKSEENYGQKQQKDSGKSGITSAFQRLVQASKRMISSKRSSEKKDPSGFKKLQAETAMQARSSSMCVDTMAIMKEQSNTFFAQPFQVGKKNSIRGSAKKRSVSGSPSRDYTEPEPESKVEGTGMIESKNSGQDKIKEILARQVLANEKFSEILEQSSMEVDTPMQRPRVRDIVNLNDQSQQSSSCRVPEFFIKEDVNPVKNFSNQLNEAQQESKQSKINLSNGVKVEEIKDLTQGQNKDYLKKMLDRKSRGLVRQRQNSQLTTKNTGADLLKYPRRNSKASHQQSRVSGRSRQKKNGSSREGTMSACSIDFDKFDKQRDDDYSDYSKMISHGSITNRVDDQRRRLESFLSLAQQAKSKRDIDKIQSMINQIDETGKPLPVARISELKLLELMASPYNQSLIAMIRVELDIAKKVKEMKKAAHKEHMMSKSKFSLPKHLTQQPSRVQVRADKSQATIANEGFAISKKMTGGESDNRLTTVVNIRPKGIVSCRSNNDVATRNFNNRSPGRLNKSPLFQDFNQPVLSSKGRHESVGKRDSSVTGGSRYSYLRAIGTQVVAQENLRKSLDGIRISSNGIELDKNSKSDVDNNMDGNTQFEEHGRRATAPTPMGPENQISMSMLNYIKTDIVQVNQTRQLGQPDLLGESQVQNMKAITSYAANGKIGSMMAGKQGFIKRIAPVTSKSALTPNDKENQTQPKTNKNIH